MTRAGGAAVALLAFAALPVRAEPQFPAQTGAVVDEAHVLPAVTQAELADVLQDLQARSGCHMVVVTVPSLQGEEAQAFTQALVRAWKLGEASKGDFVVFLIAPNDRQTQLAIGVHAPPLPDHFAETVMDEQVLPLLRKGDLPGGVRAGTRAIAAQLSSSAAKANP